MSESSDKRNTPKILLVDDKAFVRTVIERILHQCGIQGIVHAGGGTEAVAVLTGSEHVIDIVLTDLVMPDMDGIQIVRHIAALEQQPAIVFVTGSDPALLTTAERVASARGLRVLGSLEKPVSVDRMAAILARHDYTVSKTSSWGEVPLTPNDITHALEQDQFTLFYQPKVSLRDMSLAGFEALIRWQHPEKGLIPPDQFIPEAERDGLIDQLTERVVKLALTQCAEWNREDLKTKISVNLSAHMLVDLSLPDIMAQQAEKNLVKPEQIVLEITESGLFENEADSLEILARFRMKGFPLSIDDFGTGYSSLDQLRQVPFSELKIDRAFVNGAAQNTKARGILESSAALARNLGLSTVAEGAETEEDFQVLKETGVDLVQGYYISRPMPAADATQWMIDWAQKHH